MKALQERIDAIAYPPTHTYRLDGLQPTGPLAERVAALSRLCPSFFLKGLSFLDVGANKGFFSLKALEAGMRVEAVEPDPSCAALLRDLGITVHECSFREFAPTGQYDRVFVGNGPHHLWEEIRGYEFTVKLVAVTGGDLVVEGPEPECKEDFGSYRPQSFLEWMAGSAMDCGRVDTTPYTPGRSLRWWTRWLRTGCKRVDSWIRPETPGHMAIGRVQHGVFKTGSFNRVAVELAAASPLSNGIYAWWPNGWEEPWISGREREYFEDEATVWKAFCNHNLFLSKVGYVDRDPGVINWIGDPPVTCDKGAVEPIRTLSDQAILDAGQCLRQSYKTVQPEPFMEALRTRSCKSVENFFASEAAR